MLRMLALTVRPNLGPDTRYRLSQYVEPFRKQGIEVTHQSLYSSDYYRNLCRMGSISKMAGLGGGFLRRLATLFAEAGKYDVVWIGRELFPLGPALLEQILFWLNTKVILDIDDAIFLPDPTSKGFVHRRLRSFDKLAKIAGKFQAIVCGNEFLAEYFRAFSSQVHVLPTVVEAAKYKNIQRRSGDIPRIGWIGTPASADHLDLLRLPLQNLARGHQFEFEVVGLHESLNWKLPNLIHSSWSLEGELDFFSRFDIGVMPLIDSPFTRGKCAFKLIQYMAAGLPVVASPVGSNVSVVEDGLNGFLPNSDEAWEKALCDLLLDSELRKKMGKAGREIVEQKFCLEKTAELYAQLIKEIV